MMQVILLPNLLLLCMIARSGCFIPTAQLRRPLITTSPGAKSVSLPLSGGCHRTRTSSWSSIAVRSKRRRKSSSSVTMYLGFDCSLYPQLADLLYGASSKADHCRTDVLSHASEHFDLPGDLFLIVCLLALSYLSSRSNAAIGADNADGGGVDFDDDGDSGQNDSRGPGNERYGAGFSGRRRLVCPQCKGKRLFMNSACDLCEGKLTQRLAPHMSYSKPP